MKDALIKKLLQTLVRLDHKLCLGNLTAAEQESLSELCNKTVKEARDQWLVARWIEAKETGTETEYLNYLQKQFSDNNQNFTHEEIAAMLNALIFSHLN